LVRRLQQRYILQRVHAQCLPDTVSRPRVVVKGGLIGSKNSLI
jgi:hypothetical protein